MKNSRLQTIAESLRINESSDNKDFKDINGKTPEVGDFIAKDDGDVGKVKSFSRDKDSGRMRVDFRGYETELNPNSTFEIINPDDKVKKAFESRVNEAVKEIAFAKSEKSALEKAVPHGKWDGNMFIFEDMDDQMAVVKYKDHFEIWKLKDGGEGENAKAPEYKTYKKAKTIDELAKKLSDL